MTNKLKINQKSQSTATNRFREEIIRSMYACFANIIEESKERTLRQLDEELAKEHE